MVSGSTQKESNIAQKLAGKYGVSTFIHGRFSSQMPPASGLLGIDEMMAHKGSIQVGADADITVFDPKAVKINATMKDGGLPSTGIP